MTLRKVLFWLHLIAGSVAGVVILIMSVTGVLLTYERQMVAWADREYRSVPSAASPHRLGMETLLANVPGIRGGRGVSVTVRAEPTAPVEVGFGRERTLFVDAYTGRVLGEGSQGIRAFFHGVEEWHRWLGAKGESRTTGRAVTGACNLAFLFVVISGPFLWWPKKWTWQNVRAVVLFRRGKSGRARDFNWHNVIGIWAAVPLFVIVLTAVVMSYPWANDLLYRLAGSEPPAQGPGRGPGPGPRAEGRGRGGELRFDGLDRHWTRASRQVPDWRSITLRFPPSPRAPLVFSIDQGHGGRPDRRSQLALDRRTGAVVRWEPSASNNTGRQLRMWFRFLHTGEAGGWPGQTLAGLASAGAVVLTYTGLALALRRLSAWRARKRAAARGSQEVEVAVHSDRA